jgi:hypothetical protein
MIKFAFSIKRESMAKNANLAYSGYICMLLLYFFNTLLLSAQHIYDPLANQYAIRKMKSANVLVRLESFEKKLQYIKHFIDSEKCDSICKQKKNKEIEETLKSRDRFNRTFIESFRKHYQFSNVYFYYDKDHHILRQHKFEGEFYLDDSLKNISAGPFSMDSLFILGKGITPESEAEGWMFQNAEGTPMQKGFPFIIQNNAKTLITYFSSSDHVKKNCIHMVKKLNKDLFRFYHKAELKRMEGERAWREEY